MSVAREWVGAGSLERLPEILAGHQATRVLLVTGKASFAGSGAEDRPISAEPVAQVQVPEHLVCVAQDILPEHYLKPA